MVPSLRSLSSHLSSSLFSVTPPSYIFHLTFPTDSFSFASRQTHFPLVLKHFLYYFSGTALPYLDSLLCLQTPESINRLHLYLCCCLVTKSCLNLCDPMDYSLPGSSVHGISQARILERVAVSFSRGSFWPRDWTSVACIGNFTTEPRKEQWSTSCCISKQGVTVDSGCSPSVWTCEP